MIVRGVQCHGDAPQSVAPFWGVVPENEMSSAETLPASLPPYAFSRNSPVSAAPLLTEVRPAVDAGVRFRIQTSGNPLARSARRISKTLRFDSVLHLPRLPAADIPR